ncbi:MAG: (deoxy)nucleoside triphosphate pyrophosphohydrolase [Bdellovibrionales bacterium]|nr:(deoxy)nucleoside triphosphate pyrophosphohydrolase [Bdellovibrionales bacterium]
MSEVDLVLHVVAGIIYTPEHKIFIGKRRSWDHSGGKWEFPGGKVEAKESPIQALERELIEELGQKFVIGKKLWTGSHVYPNRRVDLELFSCPVSRELQIQSVAHDETAWVDLKQIREYPLLEANQILIPRLSDFLRTGS